MVHEDCTKKADALGKELSNVKAKLECLKQRCHHDPYPKTGENECRFSKFLYIYHVMNIYYGILLSKCPHKK